MTVRADESTVPSLIRSAKTYCFGREYSAFGEGRAWRSFLASSSEVLSITSIYKLLMIRSAKLVLEDYKTFLARLNMNGNFRPVDSNLSPDVLFDFDIHQRLRSAEEWNMKNTDTEAAHMP